MSKPKRIRRQRTKGWQMPENTIYVGRPTKFGNPWRIVPVRDDRFPWGDAADVIHADTSASIGRFQRTSPGPLMGAPYWARAVYQQDLSPELRAAARRELAGKDLACWCRLDQPCHADVLLEIANGGESS